MGPQHLVFQKWCNFYIRKYRYSSWSNAVLLALFTPPASQPPAPDPTTPVPSSLPRFLPCPYWALKQAPLLSDPSPSVLKTPSPSPLPKMGEVQGVKSLKVKDRKSKMPAEGNHQSESRLPSGGARLPSGGALKERPEGPKPSPTPPWGGCLATPEL